MLCSHRKKIIKWQKFLLLLGIQFNFPAAFHLEIDDLSRWSLRHLTIIMRVRDRLADCSTLLIGSILRKTRVRKRGHIFLLRICAKTEFISRMNFCFILPVQYISSHPHTLTVHKMELEYISELFGRNSQVHNGLEPGVDSGSQLPSSNEGDDNCK